MAEDVTPESLLALEESYEQGSIPGELRDALIDAAAEIKRLRAIEAELIETVKAEREACAGEAEFVAISLELGTTAAEMANDEPQFVRRAAGAKAARRVAERIRARGAALPEREADG